LDIEEEIPEDDEDETENEIKHLDDVYKESKEEE